jgi:sugar lactone lactonase YvrE
MFLRIYIILLFAAGLESCTKNDCSKGPTTIQVGLASEPPPTTESDCGVPDPVEPEPAVIITPPPVVQVLIADSPVAAPAAGAYILGQNVTLTSTTGASIFYTLDGSTPSITSFLFTSPISIMATTTIKAIAIKAGYTNSAVASFTYTINGAAGNPEFTPVAGGYGSAQLVTISSTTPGATIYFTTDGSLPTNLSSVYTAPLSITTTTTINAFATAPIHDDSNLISGTFLINGAAADPVMSPSGGTYGPAQTVTLTTTTPGASIYYTTDSSTPTTSSNLYTGPFTVSSTSNIKAIAAKAGYNDSNVTSAAFTINGIVGTPAFSPTPGGFGPTQSVTITSSTAGASIYYTTNGTTPTAASTLYSAAITVSSTTTLKAIAIKALYVDSAVATGTFTINGAVAAPTFSPNGGSFGPAQTVSITSTTSGATIYYTADGSTPTTSSTLYTSAFSVASTRTLRALAVKSQFSNSTVSSATFTINGTVDTPLFSVAAGQYSATQNVTISTTVTGTTIYYTTNGTTPTISSTVYSGPVAISSILTLQAFAVKANYTNSGVRSAIYNVTTYGTISNIAGNNVIGSDGDGGAATSANLYQPSGIAVDSSGNIFIADTQNNTVRKVTTATGVISNYAGTGLPDYGGDGSAATGARLRNPYGLAFDASENLYIADSLNHRIRKIIKTTGVISTIAGDGAIGSGGDGGPATSASLQSPAGLAFDTSGNLYIADQGNHKIRKVDTSGNITTIAGNGASGYGSDGVQATATTLYNPTGVAIDSSNNLYIADSSNHRIRKVVLSTGVITTFAGIGVQGSTGDGAAATSARLKTPKDVKIDSFGNLLIADQFNHKIRMVNASTGFISSVVGTGSASYSGNGGYSINATLNLPVAIAIGSSNTLYIADFYNNVIRKAIRVP